MSSFVISLFIRENTMLNLIISILSAAAIYAIAYFAINAGYVWSTIFAAAIFMALNFILSKRIMNKVTVIMESAGKVL